MSIPPAVVLRILNLVARLAHTAFRGTSLIRKSDVVWLENYLIKIVRRNTLGKDGGVSQMVHIYQNGIRKAVWHIVTKAGRAIHKDFKPIIKK